MNRLSPLPAIAILTVWIAFSFCSSPDTISDNNKLANNSSKEETKPEEETSLLSKYPLLSWARKTPVEIGCMLEKKFSYKDSIFNCNCINYVNKGDPCKKTDEYYEGIDFPVELASKVHSSIKEINLEFEHGNLQQIFITFKDSLLKKQIQKMFNLPSTGTDFPDNVMEISYGENVYSKEKPTNPNYTKWLTIIGFEHIGAGEVDCGD